MSDNNSLPPHTHEYGGFLVTKLPTGEYAFRRPGESGHCARTLLAVYTEIGRLNKRKPKSTGAVLPEERTTNRLQRDWARREVQKRNTDGE